MADTKKTTSKNSTRTYQRRANCTPCRLDDDGHCASHNNTISASRWSIAIIVSLLITTLGSVAITRNAVSELGLTLGPQIAIATVNSQRNYEAINELFKAVRSLEISQNTANNRNEHK